MTHYIETIVSFIGQHAEWTFPVMCATAFGESFVFLSLLFPGTSIMVAAGLLVPVVRSISRLTLRCDPGRRSG